MIFHWGLFPGAAHTFARSACSFAASSASRHSAHRSGQLTKDFHTKARGDGYPSASFSGNRQHSAPPVKEEHRQQNFPSHSISLRIRSDTGFLLTFTTPGSVLLGLTSISGGSECLTLKYRVKVSLISKTTSVVIALPSHSPQYASSRPKRSSSPSTKDVFGENALSSSICRG